MSTPQSLGQSPSQLPRQSPGQSLGQPTPPLATITSRDNPLVKSLKRLAQDNTHYRKAGQVWLEGEHLCTAALARHWQPSMAIIAESKLPLSAILVTDPAIKIVPVSDRVFAEISGLESPAGVAFVMSIPADVPLQTTAATVVLDRVQDAGNVGSILRSAAAFGFQQVIALQGTAALWSPKVLRAGMGAHFALHLTEAAHPATIAQLQVPIVVTGSHQGDYLHHHAPPFPCALVMGHEGQGVSQALQSLSTHAVRIAQPGGEESLNVAAAAAICLYGIAVGGRDAQIRLRR